MDQGLLDGKRMVDQSVGFGVTRNTYSVHSKFSENTRTEKMFDGSGKPDERNSSNAQIRRSKDRQVLRNIAKESVITNSKQLMHKKSVDSYKDNHVDRNWNFVKLINEVLQKWKKITEIPEFYFR